MDTYTSMAYLPQVWQVESAALTLEIALERFLIAKRADCTLKTVQSYRLRCGDLVIFLGGNTPVEQISPDDLRLWLAHLKERDARYTQESSSRPRLEGGLSDATRKGYVRAMKLLFGWMLTEGLLQVDPAVRLKLPRAEILQKEGISQKDLSAMVAAARSAGDIRALAIFTFFRDTGCRLGGVVGLTLDRLFIEAQEVQLVEKGSKPRWSFFTNECQQALRAWLNVRPSTNHTYLFTSEKNGECGQPLGGNGIYRIFQDYASLAGVMREWNPHQWRHFRIRAWLEAGMSWPVVAQLAGHTLPGVTAAHYSKLSRARLKEAYFRFTVQERDNDLVEEVDGDQVQKNEFFRTEDK